MKFLNQFQALKTRLHSQFRKLYVCQLIEFETSFIGIMYRGDTVS